MRSPRHAVSAQQRRVLGTRPGQAGQGLCKAGRLVRAGRLVCCRLVCCGDHTHLVARQEAQHVVQLPLLDVDWEAGDKDRADVVAHRRRRRRLGGVGGRRGLGVGSRWCAIARRRRIRPRRGVLRVGVGIGRHWRRRAGRVAKAAHFVRVAGRHSVRGSSGLGLPHPLTVRRAAGRRRRPRQCFVAHGGAGGRTREGRATRRRVSPCTFIQSKDPERQHNNSSLETPSKPLRTKGKLRWVSLEEGTERLARALLCPTLWHLSLSFRFTPATRATSSRSLGPNKACPSKPGAAGVAPCCTPSSQHPLSPQLPFLRSSPFRPPRETRLLFVLLS